jgi:hypothetical protein
MFSQEKKKVMQSPMKHQQNQPGKKVKGPILQGHFLFHFPHASFGRDFQEYSWCAEYSSILLSQE